MTVPSNKHVLSCAEVFFLIITLLYFDSSDDVVIRNLEDITLTDSNLLCTKMFPCNKTTVSLTGVIN